MKILINNYINQFNDIRNGKNWIGENFEIKLSSLDIDLAFVRPLITLHSVAEIISHLTSWRQESILKINSGKGSITDDLEDNWFGNEHLQKIGWNQLIKSYNESLDQLTELLNTKDDHFLQETYYDTDYKDYFPYQFLLDGMLHHDIYHLGQIGLVIKCLNQKNIPDTSHK